MRNCITVYFAFVYGFRHYKECGIEMNIKPALSQEVLPTEEQKHPLTQNTEKVGRINYRLECGACSGSPNYEHIMDGVPLSTKSQEAKQLLLKNFKFFPFLTWA